MDGVWWGEWMVAGEVNPTLNPSPRLRGGTFFDVMRAG